MARYDAEEEVFLERSNTIEWVVTSDDVPVTSLNQLTRAVVVVGTTAVDSSVVGSSVIWWTDSVTGKTLPNGTSYTGDVVRARLGYVDLTAGEYEDCRLVIYDATHVSGLVVSDNIHITVYDALY